MPFIFYILSRHCEISKAGFFMRRDDRPAKRVQERIRKSSPEPAWGLYPFTLYSYSTTSSQLSSSALSPGSFFPSLEAAVMGSHL